MNKSRWVLWQKEKNGKAPWSIRIGRYKNKQAAEDAIANLLAEHSDRLLMALPEGKEPQDNISAKR